MKKNGKIALALLRSSWSILWTTTQIIKNYKFEKVLELTKIEEKVSTYIFDKKKLLLPLRHCLKDFADFV